MQSVASAEPSAAPASSSFSTAAACWHAGAPACALNSKWVTVARTDTSGLALRYERKGLLATYLAFHEVDDVQHWLSSPKREEIFGPMGITARTFHDPEGSNRVGLIFEIPDMAAFQEFMQSEAAAEAMKYDGVRPETLLILSEG